MALVQAKFGGPEWDGGSILIHGTNNAGKTKLAGAAAKHESQFGTVLFGSLDLEQGHSSCADLGLDSENLGYQALYRIDSMADLDEFLALCEKTKPRLIVIDSLKAMYDYIIAAKTGGDRPPHAGQSSSNEWPTIHLWMNNRMNRIRKAAKFVIFTCPSDTGASKIKEIETGIEQKVKITPDMQGKFAEGCVTWFNLVGYLMVDTIKKGAATEIRRTLSFLPSNAYVTRQRMPKTLTGLIEVPEGNPGAAWKEILKQANASYRAAYEAVSKSPAVL
ncbi:AAA domain [Caudoviricetes sp.]|nr:AAA domain [Caudoviricetes sp.]UOF79638.1 AAA domain [Caudoviricetes sp.]UOF79828.1 AAA domain [Bacteriophage sp.]UOF81309.1 AAA domain [Caudoviricetes sp.]